MCQGRSLESIQVLRQQAFHNFGPPLPPARALNMPFKNSLRMNWKLNNLRITLRIALKIATLQ